MDYQNWLNTNTNTIRIIKNHWIRIRILFGFSKVTKYKYEYYSDYQKLVNTNTNTIWIIKNYWIQIRILFRFSKVLFRFKKITQIRIQILFSLKKSPEYEYKYYWVWKNHLNTNTNTISFGKIIRIRIRILVFGLNYSNSIRIPNYSLTSGLRSRYGDVNEINCTYFQ